MRERTFKEKGTGTVSISVQRQEDDQGDPLKGLPQKQQTNFWVPRLSNCGGVSSRGPGVVGMGMGEGGATGVP